MPNKKPKDGRWKFRRTNLIILKKSSRKKYEVEKFMEDEILAVRNKLKDRKAPGPDGLPPEVVKSIIGNNVDYFDVLFHNLMLKNYFPVSGKCVIWKDGLKTKKYR